jgi:hypothetical protein
VISAIPDQRDNARRADPITSLPSLKFGPGELSELENATAIRRLVHLTCRLLGLSPENSVNVTVPVLAGKTAMGNIARVINMAARRRIEVSERRELLGNWLTWLGGRPGARIVPRFQVYFERKKRKQSWSAKPLI